MVNEVGVDRMVVFPVQPVVHARIDRANVWEAGRTLESCAQVTCIAEYCRGIHTVLGGGEEWTGRAAAKHGKDVVEMQRRVELKAVDRPEGERSDGGHGSVVGDITRKRGRTA